MERLTIRNNDGTYSQPTKTTFEKLFYKVAEFEDLMEKYGVEDLEHLDIMLFVLSGETKYRLNEIKKENQALKDRWNKLKEYVVEEFEKDNSKGYVDFACVEEDILDKIQKLERESQDER